MTPHSEAANYGIGRPLHPLDTRLVFCKSV